MEKLRGDERLIKASVRKAKRLQNFRRDFLILLSNLSFGNFTQVDDGSS